MLPTDLFVSFRTLPNVDNDRTGVETTQDDVSIKAHTLVLSVAWCYLQLAYAMVNACAITICDLDQVRINAWSPIENRQHYIPRHSLVNIYRMTINFDIAEEILTRSVLAQVEEQI